jgi:hypothetical protein
MKNTIVAALTLGVLPVMFVNVAQAGEKKPTGQPADLSAALGLPKETFEL